VGPDGVSVLPVASFGGLRASPFVLDHPDRCDTLGIVLRPAGAYALLGRPLSEVSGLMLDGRDVVGKDVDELVERCAGTPDPGDRFALVGRWLMERFARARVPDRAVAWMAAEIERSGGGRRGGAPPEGNRRSEARGLPPGREPNRGPPERYPRPVPL